MQTFVRFFCVKPLTNTCSFTIIKLRKRTNVWNIDSFYQGGHGDEKGDFSFTCSDCNIKLRFFGHNLMQAMAEEEAAVSYSKYYTSIRLEEGDTLWKLAERYNNHSEKSMEAYVRELKSMNCLIDDTIHAGNYLTVTYYKAEPEDY